jgi:uncharacterized membrane protein YfcA
VISGTGSLELLLISFGAGILGALGGVGGGLIIVPVLTLLFGIDVHLAAGASIVAVIATSSGAAIAFVRDHLANVRIAMFLQSAATPGAIVGALIAGYLASTTLLLVLGLVLLLSVAMQVLRLDDPPPGTRPEAGGTLRLTGSYQSVRLGRPVFYRAHRAATGYLIMAGAGVASGLLGIGSGALKVLAMDGAMRLPMKVSSATSNFMIGVTAASSAGIYLARGDVDPRLASPVALGILGGALIGARLLPRLTNRQIRIVFIPILLIVAFECLARGLGFGV